MKVYELIRQLSKYPPDADVLRAHHVHDYAGTVELHEPSVVQSLAYLERPDLHERLIEGTEFFELDDEQVVRSVIVIG